MRAPSFLSSHKGHEYPGVWRESDMFTAASAPTPRPSRPGHASRVRHAGVAIAVFAVASVVAAASAASADVSTAAIKAQVPSAVVDGYLDRLDASWDDSTAARSAAPLTEVEESNAYVRDAMLADGTPIIEADSTAEVLSVVATDDRTITLHLSVTTVFDYGGAGEDWPDGSSATDTHEVVIDTTAKTPVVLSDVIVEPPAEPVLPDPDSEIVPVPSSTDRNVVEPQAQARMQPTPDIYAMQLYAGEWTSPPNDGDEPSDFNPAYPRLENNCANFVSQVLHAGGWNYQGGVNPNDTKNWSPNLTGIADASRTWTSSKYQYTFVRENGYTPLNGVYNATSGDLLYVDWDPNGIPDGSIDHVMFVSFGMTGPGEYPLINQKTPNRSFYPLNQTIANAHKQGRFPIWYGVTL